jgi:hypothetical protein
MANSPHLRPRRRSIWDLVHIGIDETGAPVHLELGERNVLIGGESGGGKSVALQLLVAHAALAADCGLVLFDGKRSAAPPAHPPTASSARAGPPLAGTPPMRH